ncbi:ATP synthase F0 subcomplex subunit H atp14 [Taxawa tesnikishii (nom. ined.)]|nr:ATP synthase F0 subcomplex subunit H atp14 [Dothideales sp. JES 119]
MLAQSLRTSGRTIARVARQQNAISFRRTFITPTAVRQADLVQDMYLRELRNYKVPQVKASDAQGHVQTFSMPQAPKSPEETDIQNELQAYEQQQVEVEGQAAEGGAAPVEQDWFEEEEEGRRLPTIRWLAANLNMYKTVVSKHLPASKLTVWREFASAFAAKIYEV